MFALAFELLGAGDLRPLFIEALGWDRHAAMLQVTVGGMTHALHAIAQKRGMIAWQSISEVMVERLHEPNTRR